MAKNIVDTLTETLFRRVGTCTLTNERYSVVITAEQHKSWHRGDYIQDVCPELTADEREFLISGFTPAEFEVMFSDTACERCGEVHDKHESGLCPPEY